MKEDSGVDAFRGLFIGCGFSLMFWLGVAVTAWVMWP